MKGRTESIPQAKSGRCLVTTSWDDGHGLDDELADLLDDVGAAATFYIPREAKYRQVDDDFVRHLSERFEVGAHSLTHPHLTALADADLRDEVRGSKTYIEDVVGKPCVTFCYPSGHVDARVAANVRDAGYLGARTVREFCNGFPCQPYLMPTTLHACNHSSVQTQLQLVKRYPGSLNASIDLSSISVTGDDRYNWTELALATFEVVRQRHGVWHLWGHSWEVEAADLWGQLAEVLRHILRQSDVTAVTNGALLTSHFKGFH